MPACIVLVVVVLVLFRDVIFGAILHQPWMHASLDTYSTKKTCISLYTPWKKDGWINTQRFFFSRTLSLSFLHIYSALSPSYSYLPSQYMFLPLIFAKHKLNVDNNNITRRRYVWCKHKILFFFLSLRVLSITYMKRMARAVIYFFSFSLQLSPQDMSCRKKD